MITLDGNKFKEIQEMILNSFDDTYNSLEDNSIEELKTMACSYLLICKVFKRFKDKNTKQVLLDTSKRLEVIQDVANTGCGIDSIILCADARIKQLRDNRLYGLIKDPQTIKN